ncbi:hypothetical protein [Phosphitispora fastidiosa]|uniref:hypothetical protein n=1 Tax=Phosphitispora fastidiosa TaxID=2837202 RepID=UPI001E369F2E|nr:hypothetical protein [Phosphitispora fastidiosa]MBU7005653.1 hypothetical protein [Phosphitispora fastidiosa]
MDIFWIIIFIGYFLFKALGKKLPEMMEDFPGGWQLPGTQDADGQETDAAEARRPKSVAANKDSERGTSRAADQRREGIPQIIDRSDEAPAAIDYRDVVNGIIMSEVLQPPLALRKKRQN